MKACMGALAVINIGLIGAVAWLFHAVSRLTDTVSLHQQALEEIDTYLREIEEIVSIHQDAIEAIIILLGWW